VIGARRPWIVRGPGYVRAAIADEITAGDINADYLTNDYITNVDLDNFPYVSRSLTMYQLHEALARERVREQLERAAHARLLRELASVRLWHRLAAYSARRVARSERRLAEHSAADYQLVG
jgi:hypothetical protein